MTRERTDLLDALALHRQLFRHTVEGLTDEQARRRTTPSELTLGGLIKHVTAVERQWTDFIERGLPEDAFSAEKLAAGAAEFELGEAETLAGLLDAYAEVARRTDELIATTDLDAARPLPPAPWFEEGTSWTPRRVVAHVLAETAQHAGHADIIREALDGQKTMG
ncbi:DinB family protein [Saccharopolyspora sp. CA-218241]|uniref:DinB family protein n=1 Tax=Saccharopolyspora sp. CA-218241 TaxID=3240027 RepID=UPI003D97F6B1